jgi:hypothetical protein
VCTPAAALLLTSEGRSSRSSSRLLRLSRLARLEPPHKQLSNRHSHPNGLNVMLLLLLHSCPLPGRATFERLNAISSSITGHYKRGLVQGQVGSRFDLLSRNLLEDNHQGVCRISLTWMQRRLSLICKERLFGQQYNVSVVKGFGGLGPDACQLHCMIRTQCSKRKQRSTPIPVLHWLHNRAPKVGRCCP